MKTLHPKQQQILDLLKEDLDNPYTFNEMQEKLGVHSGSVIYHHLSQLEKKGYLVRSGRKYKLLDHLDKAGQAEEYKSTIITLKKKLVGLRQEIDLILKSIEMY